jgi:hypothetical protein
MVSRKASQKTRRYRRAVNRMQTRRRKCKNTNSNKSRQLGG